MKMIYSFLFSPSSLLTTSLSLSQKKKKKKGNKLTADYDAYNTKCSASVNFTYKNYKLYAKKNRDELPLYIFDSDFCEKFPKLRDDYHVFFFFLFSFFLFSFFFFDFFFFFLFFLFFLFFVLFFYFLFFIFYFLFFYFFLFFLFFILYFPPFHLLFILLPPPPLSLSLSPLSQIPEYFSEDLFSVLEKKRPPYRWLLLGPCRSGSSFHVDPNSTRVFFIFIFEKME